MIRFRLRPLDRIEPWGDETPKLHWFGLSDGWYWLEAGSHELLRYTGPDDPPYVDYYVARLWEDLREILPTVLEPVPADLVTFIADDVPPWGDDEITDAVLAAYSWHGEHWLNLGYLSSAPRLRFWRTTDDGDTVTLDWRRSPGFTGPATARIAVPTEDFRAAVREFDDAFLAAMAERVREVVAAGGVPGVEIDLDRLRREHRTRVAPVPERSARTDWELVRAGVRELRQRRA
ncbi:hypothetical protein SRB5_04430 [Streptomyces sp. RB5]|uniref:Uncharacterized protein n=1 Tax=Streptomyces smaragdinus TaxID=2585196 RepID=A0A7K0CAB6_9ACTN|nr:DUF5984 family protein [Streptomyces smaragdinus]MQY10336.1 hypothetical protein [Streptomyces smaragdinus]